MNKDDLIGKIATNIGISKTDATKSVNAVFSTITSTLKGGNEVRLVGFGTFLVTNRAATTGRNPRTGESIRIRSRRVLTFKPSQQLLMSTNQSKYESKDTWQTIF